MPNIAEMSVAFCGQRLTAQLRDAADWCQQASKADVLFFADALEHGRMAPSVDYVEGIAVISADLPDACLEILYGTDTDGQDDGPFARTHEGHDCPATRAQGASGGRTGATQGAVGNG